MELKHITRAPISEGELSEINSSDLSSSLPEESETSAKHKSVEIGTFGMRSMEARDK